MYLYEFVFEEQLTMQACHSRNPAKYNVSLTSEALD